MLLEGHSGQDLLASEDERLLRRRLAQSRVLQHVDATLTLRSLQGCVLVARAAAYGRLVRHDARARLGNFAHLVAIVVRCCSAAVAHVRGAGHTDLLTVWDRGELVQFDAAHRV